MYRHILAPQLLEEGRLVDGDGGHDGESTGEELAGRVGSSEPQGQQALSDGQEQGNIPLGVIKLMGLDCVAVRIVAEST